MFKKIAALATAAVLCAGLMAGCGASSTTADTSYSAENPLVLTLAHGLSEAHTVHIAMTQFAEEVNEKTDGRVQVKIFPNGQLGSENENLEQLQAGVIAMTKVSAPGLATYNEAYNAFGLPYIFNDTEDFYHVMDSQQMQDFFLSTGDDGFVTLTYYTSGARSFYTKDKAIRTPADLKGLKIRVMSSPVFIRMYEVLGANPTPMSFSEVFTGLQQNVINGQENPPTLIYASGFQEVQKYLTLDNHVHNFLAVLTNENWLNSLSADDQQLVKDCVAEMVTTQRSMELEDNDAVVAKLQDAGMEVNELTDEQYQAFVDAVQPMYDEYKQQWGTEIFDLATSYNK